MSVQKHRIAILTSGPEFGGAEVYALEWMKALHADGHEIWYFHPYKASYDVQTIIPWCYPVSYTISDRLMNFSRFDSLGSTIRNSLLPLDICRTMFELNTLLRTHEIDVLVSFGMKSNLLSFYLRAIPQHRKIIVLNDLVNVRWLRSILAGHFTLFSKAWYVSPSRAAFQLYGLRKGKVRRRILPPPVNSNHLTLQNSKADEAERNIRKEFWVRSDAMVLTTIGYITSHKGQREFCELIERLWDEGIVVHGFIVGKSYPHSREFEKSLRKYCERQGLMRKISFTGFRNDIPEILAESDVVVQFSHFEVFGIAVAEAMAAGKPVIAWELAGYKDLIRSWKEGFLIPRDRYSIVINLLKKMQTNHELIQETGKAAQIRVSQLCNPEVFSHRVQSLLRRVAAS